MTWFMGIAGLLFVLMIISPVWFFKKVDTILLQEEDKNQIIENYNVLTEYNTLASDEQLDAETKKLNLLSQAYDRCQNPESKRIWYNKQQQYLNELKWRRLQENVSGKHTPFQY